MTANSRDRETVAAGKDATRQLRRLTTGIVVIVSRDQATVMKR